MKDLKEEFPLLGKVVRRMGKKDWEYGVIILGIIFEDWEQEYCIKYDNEDEDDIEQLVGLPYEEVDDDDYELKHINRDGSINNDKK